MRNKIKAIYDISNKKIKDVHIGCFKDMDKPLFLISEQYPGLWMEHTYDSVFFAGMEPSYVHLAENTINLFVDRQKENGQMPFAVMDGNKYEEQPGDGIVRFSQVQECVSFLTLALEVYYMNNDLEFLSRVYESGKKWDKWFRTYRMTSSTAGDIILRDLSC